MLPKKNRVDTKGIAKIFNKSRSISAPNLIFRFIFEPAQAEPKISFLTPKNVAINTPTRSTLRRRGYAVIRDKIPLLPKDIVGVFIFGKKSAQLFGSKGKSKESRTALEEEIKSVIKKINA